MDVLNENMINELVERVYVRFLKEGYGIDVLNEKNSALDKRNLNFSPEIIDFMRSSLNKYGPGNENKPGYKHAKSIVDNYDARVNGNPEGGYNKRERNGRGNRSEFESIKHFFDNFDKNNANEGDMLKYNLYGGDRMKSWINSKLGNERKSVEMMNKQNKKEHRHQTDTFQRGTKPISINGLEFYPKP